MAKTPPRTPPPPAGPPPKTGDCFCCLSCGMKIEVTADCTCDDNSGILFSCCGSPMTPDTTP